MWNARRGHDPVAAFEAGDEVTEHGARLVEVTGHGRQPLVICVADLMCLEKSPERIIGNPGRGQPVTDGIERLVGRAQRRSKVGDGLGCHIHGPKLLPRRSAAKSPFGLSVRKSHPLCPDGPLLTWLTRADRDIELGTLGRTGTRVVEAES